MKTNFSIFWVIVALSLITSNTGIAQARIPGENPIIRNVFTADPAALVYEDTVFLYAGHDVATGDEMFNIREWLVYSSTDMKTWTPHGPVMQALDFKWSGGNAWASQVIEKDEKFWFYTTTNHAEIGKDAIGVAVSDNPTGPFVDAKGKALVVDSMTPTPEDPGDWDDIDPTVFTDDEGVTWIAWGNMHLYLAKLKPNMIELDGPIRELYLPNFTEGPWIHKRKDLYYLSYACFAHQNMWEKICYATAPQITGPWTYRGIITNRTENSYTIHPAIIDFRDQWYFFYHTGKLTIDGESGAIGRRTVSIEYLYYNEDGTIKPIEKTMKGVSVPPNNPGVYKAPVFNPGGPLVRVESDISVIQHEGAAAKRWPGKPVLSTTDNPYNTTIFPESFNRDENGSTSIGQTFTVESDFTLERISLYAGDGYGTIAKNPVTLALYDLGIGEIPGTYTAEENLLGDPSGLEINYKPQEQGFLHLDIDGSRQPTLKAGHTYVVELQGIKNSAPLFWRRSHTDVYSAGSAYRNRILLKTEERTTDFGMALYGSNEH